MTPLEPGALSRRGFLALGSLSALSWRTAQALAVAEAASPQTFASGPAASAIVLWMDGGPSQLETFDPHPGTAIGGPTRAIKTRVPGIEIAAGLPQVAEQLDKIAVIRSMVGKEADHDRAAHLMRTGYQPTESLVHPAFGSICAAQLSPSELPPYISFLSGNSHSRAGYLGDDYDRLCLGDPERPPRNMVAHVSPSRLLSRMDSLSALERRLKQRSPGLSDRTLHESQVQRAISIVRSEQTRAFRIEEESSELRARYGDTPFGRACLAARRLVEVGVRCIEVQLPRWDSHVFNFETHAELNAVLDPAFATLLSDLAERDLLKSTLVVWAGEFGRTPTIKGLEGRDHWPHGFSVALAGGGIRGGQVIGETDPQGSPKPKRPVPVQDLLATMLTAMGINPRVEHMVGSRPVKLSEGTAIQELLS